MNKRIPVALAGLSLVFAVALEAAENPPEQQAAQQADSSPKPAETAKAETAKAPAKEMDARQQHEAQGDTYLDQRNYGQAIKEFDAAIAADPKQATPYVKKGIALYRSGRPQDAVPLMDKAIKLNKGDKTAQWWPLYHKGMALGMGGDLDGALKNFNESISLKPGDENYAGRAIVYANQGKPELALADVQAALKFKPGFMPYTDLADKLQTQMRAEKVAVQYLKAMAGKEGAEVTDSGLIYFELKKGDGEHPKPSDTVKVHYHGTLPNGRVFDSSVDRGEPISFPLNQVIPCWVEGLQKMRAGGKSKLVCPAKLAYGNRGAGVLIEPGAALTFEVELLAIE